MAHPNQIAIRQLGCRATGVRLRGRTGQLFALFQNSFYFNLDDALFCVGHSGLNSGPLNIATDVPKSVDWHQCGLRLGDRVWATGDKIRIGQRLELTINQTEIWRPTTVDCGWSATTLNAGLTALSHFNEDDVPRDGLARLVLSDWSSLASNPVTDYAEPAIVDLCRWLRGHTNDTKWMNRLIGLGPGLTPSGDDFIGGAMIALHAIGEAASANRMWNIAQPISLAAGNRISHAHLEAAAAGLGSAALHNAINALLHARQSELKTAVRDLDRIGHMSGWDALAGVVTAFRAHLAEYDLDRRLPTAPRLAQAFPREFRAVDHRF